ncbi:alpha/beta fold hydrolase [Myxococcota bacterium]|nr:alpha/beta fold hydrolase [Myxococcota bacterium]
MNDSDGSDRRALIGLEPQGRVDATEHFLLIHGGSHGAWCWQACVEALERRGHRATAIDLPGHGSDETSRELVTLESYVDAVSDRIEKHQGPPLTLVGHSLAGVALPQVACRHPGRISQVVFLAAIVLEPGECAMDHIPEDRRPSYFELAKASHDNTFSIGYEVAREIFFPEFDDAEAQRLYGCLTPQPLGVYLDRCTVNPREIPCPKRYIACRNDGALGFEACLKFGARLGGTVEEISGGHDVMLSQAQDLAEVLQRRSN